MTDITIENIVASTQIADELDVERLANVIPDAKYNPKSFPGLVLHFEDPETATLLFSSGKAICTGAKKMDDVNTTMQKLIDKIQKVGISVTKTPEMKMQNIVASADLKKELQLSTIAKGLLVQNVEYEPEQFPGLVYRMDDLNAAVLLFSSGKIVCTGTKTVENVSNVIERMKENLSSLGVL